MRNSIVITLSLFIMSCNGQSTLLTSVQELNNFCSTEKVYDLAKIDSLLYRQIIENIPNVSSTFRQSVKINNVGIYQIGNVGNCKDCSPATYFFIVNQNKVMLFNNNQDIRAPQLELNNLESDGKLVADEKAILIAELKRIVIINKHAEKNREKRRW